MLCGSSHQGDSAASAAGENANEAVLRCECPKSCPSEDRPVSIHTPPPAALSARPSPHHRHPRPRLLWVNGSATRCRRSRSLQPSLFPTCSQTKRPCGSFRHHCPHVISSRRCLSDTLKSVNSHIDSQCLKLSFLLLWPRHSLDPQSYYFYLFILLYTGAGSFPRWLRRVYCFPYTLFNLVLSASFCLHTYSSSRTALSTSHILLTGHLSFQYLTKLYVPCATELFLAFNGPPHGPAVARSTPPIWAHGLPFRVLTSVPI